MVSIVAMAGSDLKVKSGDKKFFKNASGNAVVEFVWDGATYDGKMPLGEKFDNLKELKEIAKKGFTEEFNDRSKKVKVADKASDANYKFTIKVDKIDQYYKVMGFVPGNATKVWGTITITDIKSGAELVVIEVKEVDGGANPVPNECFSDCFEELGKQLARM